jgi:ferrous iron transport protein A
MSITRALCKSPVFANANPSHLHPPPPNPILPAVTPTDLPVRTPHPLAELRRGEVAVVAGLAEHAGFDDGRGSGAVVLARLRDLGFVNGARCEVIAKMWPVGDPMVVRVGGSTFALRRTEAAAVKVTRLEEKPAAHAQLAAKDTSAALA